MFNGVTLKLWLIVGCLAFLLVAGITYQHQKIQLLKSQAETQDQALLTKDQEKKNVEDQLKGAQAAYRTSIAEKHALVSDLYDNRKRLEGRTKELQELSSQQKTKVTIIRRSEDETGNLDSCLPARVLSMYPNSTPCP